MKVLISVDWEGIAGLVSPQQEKEDCMLARKLMTEETNAAIDGAFAAGATEVVVNDSHGSMRNLLIERLNPKVNLITGNLKPLSMVEGVSKNIDAVLFIGYHSKMGTCHAVIDHTYSGGTVSEIRINGQPVGETTLNAAVCGTFGVPVVLVSGDDSLEEEVKLIGASHVAVKKGITRYSASHNHPDVARKQIKDGVLSALKNLVSYKPYKVSNRCTIEIDFQNSAMVEAAIMIPEVQRIAPKTVAISYENFVVAFKAMRAAITLAGVAKHG